MASGVKDDAKALAVTVRRLPKRLGAAGVERGGDSRLEVIDLDLEVEHLRLLAGPLRPSRPLVPCLALDVDVHAARGVP